MLADVLQTQLALEEAMGLGLEPRAIVLSDVAVAFASAEWAWCDCLVVARLALHVRPHADDDDV